MGHLIDVAEKGALVALDASFVRNWMTEIARTMEEQREFLTQLDSAIGDADHGVNMHRGFSAVMTKLEDIGDATPGGLLTTVGTTLISTVGGASGPLYGTAFRQAGKALGDDENFEPKSLLAALQAGLEGIQRLGAAMPGDKTIVDALSPALDALEQELSAGGSIASGATRAREAAEEGVRATIELQAKKGRASYLGPRSVGHQDPGATSTAFIFAALEKASTES